MGGKTGCHRAPAPEWWSQAASPHAPFRPLSCAFYLPHSVTCYWTQVMLFNDMSAPGPADHQRHLGRPSGGPETPSRRVCPLEMAVRVQDASPCWPGDPPTEQKQQEHGAPGWTWDPLGMSCPTSEFPPRVGALVGDEVSESCLWRL